MRRYECFGTLLTSNRPVEDWGKLLGDVAAVSAMLDRLLHHGHVLKCGPRSWRTKAAVGGGMTSAGGPGRFRRTRFFCHALRQSSRCLSSWPSFQRKYRARDVGVERSDDNHRVRKLERYVNIGVAC